MNKRILKASLSILMLAAFGAIAFSHLLSTNSKQHEARTFTSKVPTSSNEVKDYTKDTLALFDSESNRFLSVPHQDRTFSNTVLHWDEIGKMLIQRMVVLKSLGVINASEKTIVSADAAFEKIQIALKDKLLTQPQLALTVINYLEKAAKDTSLSQAECHYLYQLASSFNTDWFPVIYQNKIEQVKQSISKLPRINFTFKEGSGQQIYLIDKKSSFSLLNLNVCFLPGELPMLYGGMKPWRDRIEKVADKIKSVSADVVCLQEVFEDTAAEKLFDLLKDKYRYFYMNIGPRNFGFDHQLAGLGSGLFIASKIKIENPSFRVFDRTAKHMNRGVFDFYINQGEKHFAHIYTTHLEPFVTYPGPEFRKEQMQFIVSDMSQVSAQEEGFSATILCGDLNIPWGSNEPAEALLKENFHDAYSRLHSKVNMKNRTYVDFTDLWWKANFDMSKFHPKPEILDYALLFQKQGSSLNHYHIFSAIIPMNDLNNPLEAISDHHGEISLILFDPDRG